MIEYANVPVDELKPFGMNPRQGDVGAISVSLEANGQYRPIVVNRPDMTILVFDESGPEGLIGTGFDLDDFEEIAAAAGNTRSPWDDRTKQGTPQAGDVGPDQIWSVGPHIVGCGDSRDPAWWTTLLHDRQPHLLFTDPPYGIDYDGGEGLERDKLVGDTPDEAVPLLAAVLDAIEPVMASGAGSYICLPSNNILPSFAAVLAERNLWRWGLVWCKDRAPLGRGDYHQQHELIIYGWYPGPRHPVADRTETSVWHVPRPSDSDLYPTSKPVELSARAIRNSTRPGHIVVDPFAGSGSTLIAAHREGRVGVGNEIEPGYVNAALTWLETETGLSREQVR